MYLVLVLLLAGDAGPMRCGDDLVQPGATVLDVQSRCGAPDLRERISGADQPLEEIWIYLRPESGEQKLLHFNGVTLAAIRNAGSGKRPTMQTGTLSCGETVIKSGSTKLEVTRYCGEPEATRRVSTPGEPVREVWLYRRDARTVELEFAGVELRSVKRHAN